MRSLGVLLVAFVVSPPGVRAQPREATEGVAGTVSAGGHPVDRARVLVVDDDELSFFGLFHEVCTPAALARTRWLQALPQRIVVTDKVGRFRVDGLGRGRRHRVIAEGPGGVGVRSGEGTTLDVELRPPARISGRVEWMHREFKPSPRAALEPLPDAWVWNARGLPVKTTALGRFDLAATVEGGPLVAWKQGHHHDLKVLDARRSLLLTPTRAASGLVLLEGRPAAGATVKVPACEQQVVTDDGGRFRMEGLPDRIDWVRATLGDRVAEAKLELFRADVSGVQLELLPGALLDVRLATGSVPVSGQLVIRPLWSEAETRRAAAEFFAGVEGQSRHENWAVDAGIARIGPIEARPWSVMGWVSGTKSPPARELNLKPGVNPVTFVMTPPDSGAADGPEPRATRLSGRVVDAQRRPVAGAWVMVGRDLGDQVAFETILTSGPDGAFATDLVGEQPLRLFAVGDAARSATLSRDLPGQANVHDVELVIPAKHR